MSVEMRPESAEKLARFAERLHFDVDELSSFLDGLGDDPRANTPLSTDELSLLAESGVRAEHLDAADAAIADGWWERAIARSQLLLTEQTLSSRQAASALGLQEASVRRSLMEHRLWSFMVGGMHRIPTWQFQRGTVSGVDDERGVTPLVDGLARVIAAIPAGATPYQVQTFMTTATADLDPDRPPVSPATWLRAGERVEPVVDLLEDLVVA